MVGRTQPRTVPVDACMPHPLTSIGNAIPIAAVLPREDRLLRPDRESTSGQQEVWLYTDIDQPATTPLPVLVNSTVLPPGTPSHGDFAGRFPDGGDYWPLTWRSDGCQSVWLDPRTGGGSGELFTARVTN